MTTHNPDITVITPKNDRVEREAQAALVLCKAAPIFLAQPADAPIAILQDGDPTLRLRSEEVTAFGPELDEFIALMMVITDRNNARCLAAIQIGVPLRVIVARTKDSGMYMINPVITRTLNRDTIEHEGCLSVPQRLWRQVARPAKCDITWQDSEANTHSQTFTGEWARVLQHEIDHLDGVLITDKRT